MDLIKIKTCDLVEELKKRESVETIVVESYKDEYVKVNGPVLILVITD